MVGPSKKLSTINAESLGLSGICQAYRSSDNANKRSTINDEMLSLKLGMYINKLGETFAMKWNKEGPSMLLDLKVNDKNETILHHVCQQTPLDVDLARGLLRYRSFRNLLLSSQNAPKKSLSEREFRRFVYAESDRGENALYQCLTRFEPRVKNKELEKVFELFINSILMADPNELINNRIGQKTTVLHLLIEREQLDLLSNLIRCYSRSYDDLYGPIDFTKKNWLDKTPVMVALETGNMKIINLIHENAKKSLSKDEVSKTQAYIECITDSQKTEEITFRGALMQNKMLTTSLVGVKEKIEGEMVGVHVVELDGCRSFDFIWSKYLMMAKQAHHKLSDEDVQKLRYDIHKQVLINRVNRNLSQKHTLVVLLINNCSEETRQLSNLVKHLPYNFKVVFVSPRVKLDFADFYIKRDDWLNENICSPPQFNSLEGVQFDSNRFVSHNFRPIFQHNVHSNSMEEDIILFKQALQFSDGGSLQDGRFFEKLGDCYSILLFNSDKAFHFYIKALELWPRENRDSFFAELVIKINDSFNDSAALDQSTKGMNLYELLWEAKGILEKSGSHKLVKCYESLAWYYSRAKDTKNQLKSLNEALKASTEQEVKARINTKIFVVCMDENISGPQPKEALDTFSRFYRNSNEFQPEKIAIAHYNSGLYYYNCTSTKQERNMGIDDFKNAIGAYKIFYEDDEERIDIANSYNNMGLLYEELGDYENAQMNYKKALELYEIIYKTDHHHIAMALNNFATCYPCNRDKTKKTTYFYATIRREFLVESYEMYSRLARDDSRLKSYVAMTSFNLGATYQDLDRCDLAIPYYKAALDLYKQLGSKEDQLETLLGLHECDKENEEYKRCIIETSKDFYGKEYQQIMDRMSELIGSSKDLNNHMIIITYVKTYYPEIEISKYIKTIVDSFKETSQDLIKSIQGSSFQSENDCRGALMDRKKQRFEQEYPSVCIRLNILIK